MTKIRILTDNTPNPTLSKLTAEHGLSMFIEHNGLRILCDTGLSNAFWKNAEAMDISLKDTDWTFISHGHKDHSGGLLTFLEKNDNAPVYISSEVFNHRFFTSRHTYKHDISTPEENLKRFPERFRFIKESQWITDDIAIVRCHVNQWVHPIGNIFLTAQVKGGLEKADDFSHENSLVFNTEKGLIIVSSCSHNGALNIAKSCREFTGVDKVYAFVGGLHFVDCNQTAMEVADFQQEWNAQYPDTLLYTGHCTSDKAKRELEQVISNLHIFYTGEGILL